MMKPISLLLVDDNSTFLRILSEFLAEHHKDEMTVVGTATGGEDGLAQARLLHPSAVLLDLAMPDLTGLKVIPRLRQMMPEVGIIALSFLDPTSYRQAALDAGADEFVSKTDLTTALVPAITRVALAGATRQIHEGKSAREGDRR